MNNLWSAVPISPVAEATDAAGGDFSTTNKLSFDSALDIPLPNSDDDFSSDEDDGAASPPVIVKSVASTTSTNRTVLDEVLQPDCMKNHYLGLPWVPPRLKLGLVFSRYKNVVNLSKAPQSSLLRNYEGYASVADLGGPRRELVCHALTTTNQSQHHPTCFLTPPQDIRPPQDRTTGTTHLPKTGPRVIRTSPRLS
ncbi:uncharacterized protein C8R40DRAFT_1267535 [Lentinula edodes]|uniref:uncharacterized protein n=1 Tax=Lentinula edodes TaxID=5353 RepID=UPI001E8D2D39|nr:uncharacterized protein C8R40DRAFT_1267535 [Lentinula edodes]KAH7871534.1 hypothetical protein C8R40DRAFT_1267535 [Lentinula edodes]